MTDINGMQDAAETLIAEMYPEPIDIESAKHSASQIIAAYLAQNGLAIIPIAPTSAMHDAWEAGYLNGFEGVPDAERYTQETAFRCFEAAQKAMIEASKSPA